MTSADITELLADARAGGGAVGAMNVIQLEHGEAIVAGAEDAGRPVVLQISQNTAAYHGALAPLALAALRIAEDASVPVVVHLDHATDVALVKAAVELGVRSVMFDASTLQHAENVKATAEVTGWCHARGVAVEAELGEVGGKNGVHAAGARTDPAEAAAYVADTGVDSLAVAVGSSHAMLSRDAQLDEELIAAIAGQVRVPLVLHGSSGVPDAGLVGAIGAGMAKINIATHLNASMTRSVRVVLDADPVLVDPRRYLGAGRDAMATEVARLLTLFAEPLGVD
jgi:fructose-bisphosphate aldolase class II